MIAVPGAASVVSRSASPGGGWNAGSPFSALDTVDNIVLKSTDTSNAPWNGNASGWTSGQSDYLYAHSFGFAFNPSDTLVSITVNISYQVLVPGQTRNPIVFPDTISLAFDVIQCYNGSTIGSATNSANLDSVHFNVGVFGVALAATPTIAQINNSNFGLIIGAQGIKTGSTSPLTTNNPSSVPPGLQIDQIQLTVITTAGVTVGGGDNGHGGGPNTPLNDKNWQVLPRLGQLRIW